LDGYTLESEKDEGPMRRKRLIVIDTETWDNLSDDEKLAKLFNTMYTRRRPESPLNSYLNE